MFLNLVLPANYEFKLKLITLEPQYTSAEETAFFIQNIFNLRLIYSFYLKKL